MTEETEKDNYNQILKNVKNVLYGVAVGDALGVPVEFESREAIKKHPIKDMTGYGTYNLPPGTWSDDSSLTFCLAEALTQDFDVNIIAENFAKWYKKNFWTPHGKVFDIGITTRRAISNLINGKKPELAGRNDESSNSNGSLMRILPLLFYIKDKPVKERFEITRQVSSITHAHIHSVISCFYYLEFARLILESADKFGTYKILQSEIPLILKSIDIPQQEIDFFNRLLQMEIYNLPENKIQSSGYVVHTLEAAIWCLLTTENYTDAVLKAVNLGEDTDTTGAVAGGLAGLLYGYDTIPVKWLQQIARLKDIENLAERFATKLSNS